MYVHNRYKSKLRVYTLSLAPRVSANVRRFNRGTSRFGARRSTPIDGPETDSFFLDLCAKYGSSGRWILLFFFYTARWALFRRVRIIRIARLRARTFVRTRGLPLPSDARGKRGDQRGASCRRDSGFTSLRWKAPRRACFLRARLASSSGRVC